ncbi:ImmA/IrrE family metallo-endopeptidase [Geobacillus sp. NFOSA3]|uniref:ImmA/IrrE family metallo-endopeptidase n=1 Tax=Parageobacillus toebii TaxID=153151 RepID=UPI001491659C|nr:ImmA/IrrE family metallo-endopeptidase [Parageobacillus toebii]MED4990110.1 ImmA/IrrE family metallo-endopeptidase [Parageobacillus toebii]NNU91853.1 ImmA/IrrE family metallo-endopeptidase [Geobacillus sp. NFOSA3]
MDYEKRKEINKLANNIRSILELEPPVDIERAVKLLNGEIVEEKLEHGMEAKIIKNTDSDYPAFKIYINPEIIGNNERRKRFSIAHELGHLFLHMGYLINEEKWNQIENYTDSVYYRFGHNEEEYEAHEFAASFLMPEKHFREIAKKNYSNGYYNIGPIADHFDVSKDAATNRGRWLGMFSWE